MTTYGILLVDPTWRDQTSASLEKTTVQHHRKSITPGTHALIYAQEPIDAIVAEAVISGELVETETAPPDPSLNPPIYANVRSAHAIDVMSTPENPPDPITGKQEFGKNYRVPLDVTRPKTITTPIPLNRIKALLGESFDTVDEEWIPLKEEEYQLLVGEWGA